MDDNSGWHHQQELEHQQQYDYIESLLMQGELDYEYSYWLLSKVPEEATHKDAVIELLESGKYDDDFCEWMVDHVGVHHSDFMKYVEQVEGTKQ